MPYLDADLIKLKLDVPYGINVSDTPKGFIPRVYITDTPFKEFREKTWYTLVKPLTLDRNQDDKMYNLNFLVDLESIVKSAIGVYVFKDILSDEMQSRFHNLAFQMIVKDKHIHPEWMRY